MSRHMMWLRKQVVQEHHEGNFWVRLLTPSFFNIGIAIVGTDAPEIEHPASTEGARLLDVKQGDAPPPPGFAEERTVLVNEDDLVCEHCGKGFKSHGMIDGGKHEAGPGERWCSDRSRTWTPVPSGEPCVVTAVQTDTMEWVRDPDSPFLKPSTLPEEFPTSDLKQRVTQRGFGGGRLVNEYQCQDIPSPEWVVPLDENTLGHQIVHGDPPKKSHEKGLTWEDYMDDGTDGNAYLGPSGSPGKVGE